MVNTVVMGEPSTAVPPTFDVPLNLPGWYAIWFGVPRTDLRPRLNSSLDGVDVALDTDEGFVQIGADRGTRRGRVMGPMDVEILCFWKCAKLDGRTLRIRVPFGTYLSHPWGLTRGGLSAIALVRLSGAQVDEYRRDIADRATRRVIVTHDGFSHYFHAASPGTGIDARTVANYRDSDVKAIIYQTPCTGIAGWPSRVIGPLGDGMTEQLWKQRRRGDRRAYDYVQWAIRNRRESIRVVSELSRKAGLECHAGLRMNLFFEAGSMGGCLLQLLNGAFWRDHPEFRNPGRAQLDYARPEVRRYILGILKELASTYDVDGVSLDFTRWPPVADPERHSLDVLTSFLKETRRELDLISKSKGQRLKLSAAVVDGYHAKMSLIRQRIDLKAWIESGCLDFVCVQAWEHAEPIAWARKMGVGYYAVQDQNRFELPVASNADPEWQQQDRKDEDPLPGEEVEAQPHVNSSLDPAEYDRGFLKHYKLGVDGVCLHNNFLGGRFTGRLGHVDEMAERARTGEIWGQITGPTIELL
ncbi:MAG: hypothetical protein IT168_26400 [Bryobacterales bacterium]|nr:hypothetical protein [Bryobacterales bacterium]